MNKVFRTESVPTTSYELFSEEWLDSDILPLLGKRISTNIHPTNPVLVGIVYEEDNVGGDYWYLLLFDDKELAYAHVWSEIELAPDQTPIYLTQEEKLNAIHKISRDKTVRVRSFFKHKLFW